MSRQMINTCFSYVKWDTRRPQNVVDGAVHRIGVDTQKLTQQRDPANGLLNNPSMIHAFHQAADNMAAWLKERIDKHGSRQVPLTREGALHVINALRKTQPKNKIKKMLQVVDEIPWDTIQRTGFQGVPKTHTTIFIKNEGYPSGIKPPRLICFPAEGEKLILTMAFFHVLHPLFSSKFCTKEVPEHKRPLAIEQRLEGLPNKFVADYTAFECCASREIMQHGEHRVLRKLIAPEYHFVFPWIEAGGHLKHSSGVSVRIPAVQFSGRYTTSLSNTIRNKLFMDAVAIRLGVGDGYRGVFEGDDSLTAWPAHVHKEDISRELGKLGVEAEIEQYEDIGEAGYCSMFWNAKKELVCEPIKVLATFPFSSSQLSSNPVNYQPLLAAKAMSLAYRAPGCPIISAVVRRYIGSTGYMDTRNDWERRWYAQFTRTKRNNHHKAMKIEFLRWDLVREPSDEQRELFHKVFNVDITDQKLAEQLILREDGFSPTLAAILDSSRNRAGADIAELMTIYTESRLRALDCSARRANRQ